MCDRVDGVLTISALIAINLIDYSIAYDHSSHLDKYPFIKDYENSLMMSKTPANIRIEACLTILTILSALISDRKDIKY